MTKRGRAPTLLLCTSPPGLREIGQVRRPAGPTRRWTTVDDELLELLTSTVGALGLELVDAEVRAGLVRVVVDRTGDAADVDVIADATRAVSGVLDSHDPLPGRRYTLEVSSPGVERPLRTPRHFIRAVGEVVTVRTTAGGQGGRRVTGRLAFADEDGFVIEDQSLRGDGRHFAYSEVERARTVFEWPATTRPEGTRRGGTGRHGETRRQGRTGRQEGTSRGPSVASGLVKSAERVTTR